MDRPLKKGFCNQQLPLISFACTRVEAFSDFLELLCKTSTVESPHYRGRVSVGPKLVEISTKETSNVMNK